MRRLVVAGAMALMLGGCGGSGRGQEDFAITVKRPVASVFTVLGTAVMPSEVRAVFPQLKIERTRPNDNEVLYTIPGDGEFPATIRFRFDAAEGGKATTVHAFVDVPAIKVNLAGKPMVLSEARVERALNRYLERVAKAGGSGGWGASPMPETLLALAIATNSKTLAEFQDMEKHPDKFAGRFAELGAVFGGDGDSDEDLARDAETVDSARPQSDPNRDVARAQMAQWEQRAREEEARAAASRPMNEAKGADVSPGRAGRDSYAEN